jgi:hypothetical protein
VDGAVEDGPVEAGTRELDAVEGVVVDGVAPGPETPPVLAGDGVTFPGACGVQTRTST